MTSLNVFDEAFASAEMKQDLDEEEVAEDEEDADDSATVEDDYSEDEDMG